GKNEVVASRDVDVGIASPREYVAVTGARFEPAGAGRPGGARRNRLVVRLRLRDVLPPPPCRAELVFPPGPDGLAPAVREGTLRGILPPKGEELMLFAEGVR